MRDGTRNANCAVNITSCLCRKPWSEASSETGVSRMLSSNVEIQRFFGYMHKGLENVSCSSEASQLPSEPFLLITLFGFGF